MTDQPVPRTDFYVYALLLEDGETPFYIGKGSGNRINVHDLDAKKRPRYRKDNIIRDMWARGVTFVPRMKLSEGLTNDAANSIEKDLIRLIGRMPNGPLANHTDGGDGVVNTGAESRAKQAEANRISWADPATRAKRIEGIRAAWTPEKRELLRQKKLAAMSPETRVAIDKKRRAQAERSARHAARRERKRLWLARERVDPKKAVHRMNTPEVNAKKRATMSLPHIKAAKSAAQKKAFNTPEAKAKRSAASKKMWAERREEIIRKRASKRDHLVGA